MKAFISKLAFILCILFLLNIESVKAQNQTESKDKNTVYLSYGNIIFSSQMSFSYERLVAENSKMQTRLKVNYGHYLSNNADYETDAKVYENFTSISAVQLIGLLELNLGVAYTHYKLAAGFDPLPDTNYTELKNGIDFYGNIGVRYSKDNFIVRAGIGNLELLYFGVGVNF